MIALQYHCTGVVDNIISGDDDDDDDDDDDGERITEGVRFERLM
jgi:hypothetical protein